MKKIYSILAVCFCLVLNGQININSNFSNGLSGWTFTSSTLTASPSTAEGILNLSNSGTTEQYFTLKSSEFPLFSGKSYNVTTVFQFTETITYDFDPNNPVPTQFYSAGSLKIVLKKSSGEIVFTSNDQLSNGFGFDVTLSKNLLINDTDTYYMELQGTIAAKNYHTGTTNYRYYIDKSEIKPVASTHKFSGNLKFNLNNDNCASSTSYANNIPLKLYLAQYNSSIYTNTDNVGNYSFGIPHTGDVKVTVNHPNLTSIPAEYNYTLPSSPAQNYTNQNFCITSNALHDVKVTLIPLSESRPGFPTRYRIDYFNNGNTVESGTFSLNYNSAKLNYNQSSVTPLSTGTGILNYNFSNLAPFQSGSVIVDFTVAAPPQANNGDTLNFASNININGDEFLNDNTFTLTQVLIGSYDPNDITCLQGEKITSAQAADYLYYMIRFQNTGTASAINVNVNNVLDNFLDPSTLEPISASHQYQLGINGRILDFYFPNINLADSTSNEPESHGWILYRVKPLSTFVEGKVIHSKADIYFDYNIPIVTNDYTTQIDNSTMDVDQKLYIKTTILENPVGNMLKLNSKNRISSIEIFDLTGKIVKKATAIISNNNSIDVSGLSSGLYILKVETQKGNEVLKFIKR